MDAVPSAELLDLKAQLDEWRRAHRKRARIPAHFYHAAVALLDRHTVSLICRETRLRSASLRKHADPSPPPETSRAPPRASFLQLDAAQLAAPSPPSAAQLRASAAADSPSRLLFERSDGSRLTIHLPSPNPQQLEALCLCLLRA